MKKLLLFFVLFRSIIYSQSYLHLEELRGLEDSLGNTNLFYRQVLPTEVCWIRSIYHLNINSTSDTLFIYDAAVDPIGQGCRGQYIYDYEFINDMISEFVYGGLDFYYDAVPIFVRYDGSVPLPPLFPFGGGVTEIERSFFDSGIIYLNVLQFGVTSYLLKSTDGGYNFFELNTEPQVDYYLISLSKNNDSQIYGIDDNKLVRSEDEGYSYIIVDNSDWSDNTELFYDYDGNHIYGLSVDYDYFNNITTSKIFVSNDNGNPFTWSTPVEYDGKVWFTHDQSVSGEIYYSARNRIYKSTDFGNSFLLYKQLDRNVTGLYKKSGTNKLYASTPLKIYEITPDTIQVIKSLPIPEDAFAWLPLNLGDKWVYNNTFYGDLGDSSRWISVVEEVGYKTIDTQTFNEVLVKEIPIDPTGNSDTFIEYFRVDSSNGEVYQAWIENDSLLLEELYMDLLAEVGDTIPVGNGIYLASEEPFTIFGLDSWKRTFYHTQTPVLYLELVNGLGMIYQYRWELVGVKNTLKGCFINGIVYGDTSVVSVEDEETPVATTFQLCQNYPNPFNPSTTIKFAIPDVTLSRVEGSLVTLKVYDVLGNEIATLVNEELPAGEYEFEFSAKGGSASGGNAYNLPSGIYFYQLKAGTYIETKKMILMK